MNATTLFTASEIPSNRIQKVSKGLRLFVQYGFPILIGVGVLAFLAYAFWLMSSGQRVSTGEHSRSAYNPLWSIPRWFIYLYGYRTLVKLLGSFEKGVLFTAETVRCIQILGWLSLLSTAVQMAKGFVPAFDAKILVGGLGGLSSGLLIIFIAWVMDEARKMREEQALTI